MGDGIFDHFVMQEVGYSIAFNADENAKRHALLQSDQVAIEQLLRHVFTYFPASFLSKFAIL